MRRGNGGGRGEEQWKINRGEVFGIIGLRLNVRFVEFS